MGVKISWDSQAGKGLDAIEIYRSSSKIDPANPGKPLVSLDPSLTEYEDMSVANKNLYYYCIAAKKGTERAFGRSQLTGYFSETGPGREVVYRGDWNAGYMDMLPAAQFVLSTDLFAKIPDLVYSSIANPSYWWKFAYKGKVLFMPNANIITTTWDRLYAAGLVYGEDGYGVTPYGAAGSVNQKRVVEINGLEYIVRCARLSNIGTDKSLTIQDDTIGSEFRSTLTRLLRSNVETQAGALSRLGSETTNATFIGRHFGNSASNVIYSGAGAAAANITNIAKTSNISTGLVLELIMP